MAVNSGKKARRAAGGQTERTIEHGFKSIKPLTEAQAEYQDAIHTSDVIFGIGDAGTGKTFVAASYAAEQLFYRKVDKVILTRPNEETGPKLGFLPGELEEKYAPYLDPFDKVFSLALGRSNYELMLKSKRIEPKPLGFMRGASFDNAIILVDEAQNITKDAFKMLLSRIGRNCKVILSGDPDQVDINNSGLKDAVRRLGHLPGISVVEFTSDDIVRSAICKQIILAYKNK